MPSERLSPDDPREWLNRASSNLIRAKTHNPEVYLEDLCFDAQEWRSTGKDEFFQIA